MCLPLKITMIYLFKTSSLYYTIRIGSFQRKVVKESFSENPFTIRVQNFVEPII